MFNSIFIDGSLTAGSVFLSLGLALLLGFAGSFYYTKRNVTATRSFAFTLALLPVIITTVIMVVNGNLGAGIAVAGSFSLIRFRSVQGSAQEILAVFLAAAVGLCLGAGYAVMACLLMLLPVFSAFAEDVLTGGSVFISGYYTGQVQEDGTVNHASNSGGSGAETSAAPRRRRSERWEADWSD